MTIAGRIRTLLPFACVAAVAALVALSPANAGQKEDPVYGEVYIGGDFASGTLSAVRASNDETQLIECSVLASSGSLATSCRAVDATGKEASCFSESSNLAAAASGINGDSFVEFHFNKGTCTLIRVTQSSTLLPKLP